MRVIIFIIGCLVVMNSSSQTRHSIFIGGNISSTDLNARPLGPNITSTKFQNSKLGFSAGYKYFIHLGNRASLSLGAEFKVQTVEYFRPFSNDPNDVDPNLTSIQEDLKYSRVTIPLQGYYFLIKFPDHSFFVTAGLETVINNRVSRTADYKIPAPPNGFAEGRFNGKQTVKFDNSSVGLSFYGGIGNKFSFKKNQFIIELTYLQDLEQSKIQTLENIEYEGFYYGKLKSYNLKLAYLFRRKNKVIV